jgi:hypothetical protein
MRCRLDPNTRTIAQRLADCDQFGVAQSLQLGHPIVRPAHAASDDLDCRAPVCFLLPQDQQRQLL